MRGILDDIDKKIIEILQKDGKVPLREISKITGLAESTIHERIKRLRESGVIKKFTAVVNPEALGYNILAFILIKVKAGKYSEVASKLVKYPEIVEVYETTGDYDMVVKIRTKNSEELNNFLDMVGSIEGVEGTHTMIVLKVHKETTELPVK
ncbi:transcriptional regulator [Pyrococcus furiosus DSM 3638]|uniref:HTH-type transcriptional regulator FL11 n=3 Tax=Pyrococcus furiosus TaxID=2261 RepID=REG6_PYRFU|nr:MULTISPECIES: Lrp/AsnC family transcriptional regulator [Pyrococcus]Q8U0P3.1 RecName: Full=HTH-type transcriptional regulator FL11; AltName: Full=Feast/famine regulatory protein FL11; Short=FFRP FL11 [Pyrococcus furiosus DSM 3638]AAL81667.1 transcriptional regulatory protein, asnC family [Pyrococcus furiosus DSM 3638]AFN04325.1 AsnC family transcriptional regulator [Pyrococcus furiosus COM1]MDK2869010.1 Lrp/AsnC family transcriptional regulator, regulator for asnA, asnC and gidA [Pyrococcus 